MRMTINSVLWLLIALLLILCSTTAVYSEDQCAEFQAMVRSTYNFKPSKLNKAEKEIKSKAMDDVWSAVEAKPKELLPCLRAALEDPKADSWFRFDGSSLLVKLDPSSASKSIQVRSFLDVDLDDADLRTWVQTLSRRATEGFDVSEAVTRWLNYPKAKYYLPEHGAYEVSQKDGALFILGCMDESKALPILLKIISDQNDKHREFALWMMTMLATSEALQELKKIDLKTVSERTRQGIQTVLTKPQLISPRKTAPKVTREEYLKAFENAVNGNWKIFDDLVEKVSDGERDALVVLKTEDLSLLRKVRRLRLSYCNQHAIEYYDDFTGIILTLVWKAELVK
jgi:hypothetical protein